MPHHVVLRITIGPSPDRQRTVLVTADPYIIGTALDAVRWLCGFEFPELDPEEPAHDEAEGRPPVAHKPRAAAAAAPAGPGRS